MDKKNKIIITLVAILIIFIVTCVVTYKLKNKNTYPEQLRSIAKNIVNDIL